MVAPVAQRLEQQTHNLLAVGSNPTGGTTSDPKIKTKTCRSCQGFCRGS